MSARYAELQVTSHFSFLRGASSAEELFARAAELGIEALAVTDRNSLAGIVRAHVAAKETGVRLVVGCRLDLADGTALLVYPTDKAAYARLSRLLSLGKRRGGKGRCHLEWVDVAAAGEGQVAVLLPDGADDACAFRLGRLRQAFDGRAYLALTLRRRPDDALRLWRLSAMAAAAGVPTVVTNDVLFHEPGRRMLQDVVTAIRHNVTIDELGFRRERHADRHLKPPDEMHRLFSRHPEALARTLEIAARCRFSLEELRYQYPEERADPSLTPQQTLEALVREGMAERFPAGVPDKVAATLRHELDLIARLNYAPYFLTVHSIVRFARSASILCQGRGSAANSAVCYVLGITSIDPVAGNLLFERFVSDERREPPDIDVDFEHERREEVIQWIYDTYGRDRAALCATVIRYRTRGAIRDVGKALGLPEDMTKVLSAQAGGHFRISEIREAGDLGLDMTERRLRLTLELAGALVGAPRHLSQHPGGFVLSRDRLDDLVPVEPAAMAGRQVIEWDKDDIAVLDFMKVDVLALGMLSCMRRAFDLLAGHKGLPYDLYSIPDGDAPTYAMISRADTLGTFQIESRAQMSMLPRLKPKTFYDLVIQIAIVRPGPIQGDMVHPYLRRREGKEKVDYPSPAFEAVLGKTLGVPLFQEQAMKVAIECAGFSANEADRLRRAMATFKNVGTISAFQKKLVDGMVANDYQPEFAARIFRQLEGFGSYGFPESHAASFAKIAYASAWVKCHHPEVFCCALLNAQPMGFYAPAQIVRDARAHGVEVLPVCINASRWDCTLERRAEKGGLLAVRLGLRLVKGLANGEAARLVIARGKEPYRSVDGLWRRADLAPATLAALAGADAFRPALGLARREALWAIKALREAPLPLFAAADAPSPLPRTEQDEPPVRLHPMPDGGEVVEDYGHLGLTLRAHPLSFLRADLARRRIVTCAEATAARDRARVEVAGLILVRQRPGSARGVVFMTLEDETAIANVVIWQKLFQRDRAVIIGARLIGVRGRVQREGEVVHIVAERFLDLSKDLATVGARGAGADLQPRLPTGQIHVRSRDFK